MNGLVHSRVTVIADHSEFDFQFKNISLAFFTSFNHFHSISKIQISEVAQKRFLIQRSIFSELYLSHSKCKTTSTKCARACGQAISHHFVTCQINKTGIQIFLKKCIINSEHIFICEIHHADQFAKSDCIVLIESITTNSGKFFSIIQKTSSMSEVVTK